MLLFMLLFKGNSKISESDSASNQKTIAAARKEGYDLGYKNGYNAAQKENDDVYQKGYQTAKKDIGSGALTRSGILGFIVGLFISTGGFVAIKKKELSERFEEFKHRIELRRAFKTIPSNLPPDVDTVARQIARSYVNVLVQLRMSKGYTVSQYIQQWTPRLDELIKKSLRLMDLIKELETARANIDEQELTKTIKSLQRKTKNPKSDDATRNTAVKSLQRAKQTQKDLVKTHKNLEHCKTSLQGVTGILDSMQLKISNLKVNTQATETLEELSSDLEAEMSALEEALRDIMM